MLVKKTTKNIQLLSIYSKRVFYGDVTDKGEFLQINATVPQDIQQLLEV